MSQESVISSSASENTKQAPLLYNLSLVNRALEAINIKPIPEDKADDSPTIHKKLQEMNKHICGMLKVETPKSSGDRVLEQFIIEYDHLNNSDQYRILTSMPRDTNQSFLQKTFGVKKLKAKRAKECQQEKGLLSTPDPKPGNRVPSDTLQIVKEFYQSDKVSRQMAGMRDCVTMKVNGNKEKVQKKMLLCTLYEAYTLFKEDNPDIKISFGKFAEVRPKNVFLPGSAGTHVVCVCSYHQNPKLMIVNSQISTHKSFKRITENEDGNRYTGEIKYNHLIAQMMCNPPSVSY